MKSGLLGRATLEVEVTDISRHGLRLLVDEEELFLPFDEFPWFKEASVSAVLNVERQGKEHLYRPDLDVDLLGVDQASGTISARLRGKCP